MNRPYFILGTPRSRTAWLAEFLSTPRRPCLHEPTRFCRSRSQLHALIDNEAAAISDSGLTLAWTEIQRRVPEARVVVVRRPLADVARSLAALGFAEDARRSVGTLLGLISDEIEKLLQAMPALVVPFGALASELVCAEVYEFCLGLPVPAGRWATWAPRNVQADVVATVRDVRSNAANLAALFPGMLAA